MAHKVFIDGEVGTTGLQIRDRLAQRTDIELVSIDPACRKNLEERLRCLKQADVGILCLPDAAAVEVAERVGGSDTRLIDASTAHRVHDDWAFGFPELNPRNRAAIGSAKNVSTPGCYSTCAIALLYPLVRAGLMQADACVSINAISGYSGGGKGMIEEFQSGAADSFFVYGMAQNHKHIPEIMQYSGLNKRPVFVPSVGHFEQGMLVQIPLAKGCINGTVSIRDTLSAHYSDSHFVSVVDPSHYGDRMDPQKLNGTNRLELSVHGDEENWPAVLIAVLDNLGKGASGAAVQNLNIMLGLDEGFGL
ncbi:MAG: N-acetyl-gamma-glutamyl-phosphate reductase [Roseobacter sp.]